MSAKKTTKSQLVGLRGEQAFRHLGTSIGLIPMKVEEDYGIDFICQVVKDPAQTISTLSGILLGAAVRTTGNRRGRIRLDRNDVETLLNCRFPVMIVLVRLGNAPCDDEVYLRLIDDDFAMELATFLSSTTKHISFTPSSFSSLSEASVLMLKATSPGFSERIHLLLTQQGLSKLLPEAHLQITQSPAGNFSLVKTSDIWSQFDLSTEEAKKSLHTALFGSNKFAAHRLAQIPLKDELWQSIDTLPKPVIITGKVEIGHATLIVEGFPSRCAFEVRQGINYTAFVHECGFSIRMSDAVSHDGTMVHHLKAEIDKDNNITFGEHPDLWNFLAECLPGRRWKSLKWKSDGVPVETTGVLYRFGCLAHYLRETCGIEWPPDAWRLGDAESDEVLDTLAFATQSILHPQFLSRVPINMIDAQDAEEEVSVSMMVPVCSNLPGRGLVLWLSAEGTALIKDEAIAGVTLSQVLGISPEFRNVLFSKASSKPELVINPHWPTVAFGQTLKVTSSDPSSWGCEAHVAPL